MTESGAPARSVLVRLATAALIVLLLDQVTKQLALDALRDGPIEVVEGVFSLRLTFNSGGAFGILQGFPQVFLVATLLVMVGIVMWARRLEHVGWAWPLGLVLGGGLGNLFDRVFRSHGGRVVDFLDLHVWPVFNLADSAIVVGAVVLLFVTARDPARERADGGDDEQRG